MSEEEKAILKENNILLKEIHISQPLLKMQTYLICGPSDNLWHDLLHVQRHPDIAHLRISIL